MNNYTLDQFLKLIYWLTTIEQKRLPFVHIETLTIEEQLDICAEYELTVTNPEPKVKLKLELGDFIVAWNNGKVLVYKDINGTIEVYAMKGKVTC